MTSASAKARELEGEKRFVEGVGILFEEDGLPRMAGRILGRLLVAVPAEQSSSQLASYLDASKGSISTMTRQLIQMGLVERVGIPGERQDHFRMRPGSWERFLTARLRGMERMHLIAEQGLRLPAAKDPDVRDRLESMHSVYEFLSEQVPPLLEQLGRDRRR
jgi:DNA-binding MarR family transcriptional regulator